MKHSKSAQLETAPTKYGGQSVFLFFEFTIVGLTQLDTITIFSAPPVGVGQAQDLPLQRVHFL